jgi:hypothetical protein
MGAKSTHNSDIQVWIQDTINSCVTIEHCVGTSKLIDLFNERLKRTTKMDFQLMLGILDLKTRLNRKLIEIRQNEKQSI